MAGLLVMYPAVMWKTITRAWAYEILVAREAYKAIGRDLKRVFSSVVRGLLVAVFGFLVFGTVFSIDRVLGLVAPLVFAFIYFFWKLFIIPSQLHVEQKKREENSESASELADEFTKGGKLLRRHAERGEHIAWIDDYDEWCERVSEKLKRLGDDQAFMFDSIGFFDEAKSALFAFEREKSMEYLRNNLAARLEKLRLITGRVFGNAGKE